MKNKILLLVIIMCFVGVPVSAFAEEETPPPAETETAQPRVEDLYTYELNTAGRAEIISFKQKETYQGELIIPQHLDGYEVGYIENAAFQNAKGITSVTIPATVTDIGNCVFFGCENIQKFTVEAGNPYLSVTDDVLLADNGQYLVAYPPAKTGETYTIPDSVNELAPGCFGFSKNLKEISIPQKVNFVDEWAFAYSSALEKVSVSSPEIDEYAFAYCNQLHEVALNSGVEEIQGAAFGSCSALTEITLPETLTYVGQLAFSGTGMMSVTIPPTVSELDYGCFGYDANLNPVNGFTIYGKTNSSAEAYATAEDEENNYENHFQFIALEDVTETETSVSEENAEEEETQQEEENSSVQEATDAGISGKIGAELTHNQFLQIVLATVGGIAVILALTLMILVCRKPKKHNQNEDKKP